MVDFMEFGGGGLQGLVNVIEEPWQTENEDCENDKSGIFNNGVNYKKTLPPRSCLEVRPSVCVAGFHKESIQYIKKAIASMLVEPMPLESFHVKKVSDIEDGAFLVPKIILVAVHCPGVKLLDEESDQGQLDFLYDEATAVGADIMIIYTGLPKLLYPQIRNIIYHPKVCDTLFRTQPLLQELASNNCFLTITQDCKMTSMQKNLLQEWLSKPVGMEHPVYKTADHLQSLSDAEYGSSGDFNSSYKTWIDDEMGNSRFVPATEFHPLADKKKKRREKKKTHRSSKASGNTPLAPTHRRNKMLGTLTEESFEDSLELNQYSTPEDLMSFEKTTMIDV